MRVRIGGRMMIGLACRYRAWELRQRAYHGTRHPFRNGSAPYGPMDCPPPMALRGGK